MLSACAYSPAGQQRARVEAALRALPNVESAVVACDARLFATDTLCAAITFSDNLTIHFDRVGTRSFGVKAAAVVVTRAAGLVPLVASCAGVAAPNFHRDAELGHHFRPPLLDLADAVTRHRDLLKEIDNWPQCPQFYELQDRRGVGYRYCARRADAAGEPPPLPNCH
jgi:hypothetical protein